MDDVVAAIADPVRRQILDMLREGPLPARRIAEQFAVSRPAVSRHLRVLRESGLVRDVPTGRERLYHLDPGPLITLTTWIADLRDAGDRLAGWERRLDALTTEVYRARRDRRRTGTGTGTDTDIDIDIERRENTA
ncbi:ArsR/SmtB family transcription factor [Actinoplanes solisilvae]|uniref:ArsR/SmtB family transcription factor n=1 Tax=Actinoplanes solisilvae TaxID=2486853 RepID=UPI000FD9DCBB|nr:metalloregulator ArsR/SmtB family transcription factor [Actinoplanes solisilvae]